MPGRHGQKSGTGEMCLYFIAVLFPPLAVALRLGQGGVGACDVLINVLLCVLGWIPGVIHAFWIISRSFTRAQQRTYVVAAGPPPVMPGMRY